MLKLSNIFKSQQLISTSIRFGTRMGTDEDSYKAPEMFEQEIESQGIYGIKADCWAIGIIICYLWKL